MESSGAAVENAPKNKTLFIVLGVFGVLIVGLVIAIAIVKSLPKGGGDDDSFEDVDFETMVKNYENYDDIVNEISNKINSDQLTAQDTMALYRSYIDATNNAIVKAMLNSDYYLLLMEQDVEKQWKEDIVSQLISDDDIIRTENSALIVAMAAGYYQDEELMQQYNNIAAERATTEQRIEDTEGQE